MVIDPTSACSASYLGRRQTRLSREQVLRAVRPSPAASSCSPRCLPPDQEHAQRPAIRPPLTSSDLPCPSCPDATRALSRPRDSLQKGTRRSSSSTPRGEPDSTSRSTPAASLALVSLPQRPTCLRSRDAPAHLARPGVKARAQDSRRCLFPGDSGDGGAPCCLAFAFGHRPAGDDLGRGGN